MPPEGNLEHGDSLESLEDLSKSLTLCRMDLAGLVSYMAMDAGVQKEWQGCPAA